MYQENKEFTVYAIRRKNNWNVKNSKWNRKQGTKSRYAAFVQKCKEEKELKEKTQIYWDSVLPILQDTQAKLVDLGNPPSYKQTKENILYCVQLFSIASECQDKLDPELKMLPIAMKDTAKAFNNDLFYSGRHSVDELRNDSFYGKVPYWNTTDKGEAITIDNICFGPELGLPRKPASYWLKLSKKKRVYLEEQKTYAKGILSKTTTAWATDALVKVGINHFIRTAYQALTTELETLLG